MARRYKYSPVKTKAPAPAKNNKPRINKTMVTVFVILISAGLLGSTILWSLPNGSFNGGKSAAQAPQNNDQLIKSLIDEVYKNPKDPAVRVSLGDQYYQAQKFNVAIEQYEKAVELGNKDANVYGDLATSYFYTGKADKAIETAKKGLEIQPNHPVINVNLARYMAYGKNDLFGAVAQLEKYLKVDKDNKDAKQLLTDLQLELSKKKSPQNNAPQK